MKHKVHVVVSDMGNHPFPFDLYVNGEKVSSTHVQAMLQEASNYPENYDFMMSQEERAKFVAQLLPILPQPNIAEIRASSPDDRARIMTITPTYLMNAQEPVPVADVVGSFDDASSYLVGFGQSISESIAYGINNTPVHKLPGYGTSNKVFGRQVRLRSASKKTVDFIDHHIAHIEKYTKYLTPLKFAASCYDYSHNEDYGYLGALAHASFDFAVDSFQENYISVKGGLKAASRYVISAATAALGINLTGGLAVMIPFIISEGGEYFFVEYVWSPSIEWLKNDANIAPLRLVAPPELIRHGIDLSDHETPYIPQLSQPLGQTETPDHLAIPSSHTAFAPLPSASSVASSSWFGSDRLSSTIYTTFDRSNTHTSPVSLVDKQLKVQSALRREFDYKNPTSFHTSPQDLLWFDPNRLISTENPSHTYRAQQPSFSFSINNDGGSLRWQASVDPIKHPKIAGGLFALHLIKHAFQWLRLSESDKCKHDIQTHIRHFDELQQNTWLSYNTWLKFRQNSQSDIQSIHKQRLAASLTEYAGLNPKSQEIISAVKVMHFLNATDNYDGLKLFAGTDSHESDFNKYTDLYTQTLIKQTGIVINALNDHQLKRAEREIVKLTSMFPHEPLTHATRGALLFEKKQYSDGEAAFAKALHMATAELQKLQESPVVMVPHDATGYISEQQRYMHSGMQHHEKINTAKASVSDIEKMLLASYHHAYQNTQEDQQQHILRQWEHAACEHVSHNPHSYDAKRGLVDIYLLQNKTEEAIHLYTDIDKSHKNLPDVKFNLGLLLYQNDQAEEARLYLQDYQNLSGKIKDSKHENQLLCSSHILKHIFMDEYAKTQDISLLNKAAEQAKVIAGSSTTSTEQRLEQIRFIACAGQLQDALDLAKTMYNDMDYLGREKSKNFVELNQLLGEIQLNMKNPEAAQGHFALALLITPNDPALLTQYGLAKLHNNDLSGAKAAFEQVLLHQPEHAMAQSNIDAINDQILSKCLSDSVSELGMAALDFGFSYLMPEDPSLGRAVCLAGKLAVAAVPYIPLFTDLLGQTHAVAKTVHLGELVLRYQVPALFVDATKGYVRGAIGNSGYTTMQCTSFALSSILILDSYHKGYYLGERREHMAAVTSVIAIASKIEQLSGGAHMLSSIQDFIGADLASNIVCVEGTLFLVARSFDLAEYFNKQCGNERWENGVYHASKIGLQTTATVAGFGALVGKAALAALAKSAVSCNPYIIVGAVGTAALSAGAYQTYYYYADSQLTAMVENARARLDKKDLSGALQKINECKSMKTENTQLITYIHSMSAEANGASGNYHDAASDLDLCYQLNPTDADIKLNRYNMHRNLLRQQTLAAHKAENLHQVVELHQNFLRLFPDEPKDSHVHKYLHSTKLMINAQDHAEHGRYKHAVYNVIEYILNNPDDDSVKDYLLSLYAKRWELLVEKQKVGKAIGECENFMKLYGNVETAQFIHTRMQLVQSMNDGTYQHAIAIIDNCLSQNPHDNALLLEKRQALSLLLIEQATQQANQTHLYQTAFDAFASHMANYPDDLVVQERWQRLRYHAAFTSGDFQGTIHHCDAILTEHIADSQALRYRSRAYMALNQLSAAESDIKLLLSFNQQDHDAWFQQSIIDARRGYLGIPLKRVKTAISCLPLESDDHELRTSYEKFHQSLETQIQSLQNRTIAMAVGHTVAAGINYATQYYMNATSSTPSFFTPSRTTVRAPSMHISQKYPTIHFNG